MANETVSTLVIDVVADATKAAAGLDDVGDASVRMSKQVEDASASAERAGRNFAVSAEGADNLASKSGQATGALGALASGFELVGLEKYSGALQGASMATDFFSGVGDSLNLVLESQAVKTAIARANAIRHAVTSRVVAGATRVWAAGQWVLNAALNANPIGLVVAAVALLIAGLVLAYKKSATFRGIVQAVGKAGKAAIGWVVDAVGNLVDWLGSHLPAAGNTAKRIVVGAVNAMLTPPRNLLGVIKDLKQWAGEKLPGAFQTVKDKITGFGDKLASPFKSVLGVIKDIIDFIKKIHIPHVPGFGRVAGSGRVAGTVGGSSSPVLVIDDAGPAGPTTTIVNNYYTITGAIDPQGTVAAIDRAQSAEYRRLGLVNI